MDVVPAITNNGEGGMKEDVVIGHLAQVVRILEKMARDELVHRIGGVVYDLLWLHGGGTRC